MLLNYGGMKRRFKREREVNEERKKATLSERNAIYDICDIEEMTSEVRRLVEWLVRVGLFTTPTSHCLYVVLDVYLLREGKKVKL